MRAPICEVVNASSWAELSEERAVALNPVISVGVRLAIADSGRLSIWVVVNEPICVEVRSDTERADNCVALSEPSWVPARACTCVVVRALH